MVFPPQQTDGLQTQNIQHASSAVPPKKKLMYILGRSVEWGILFSLLDIMLEEDKKRFLLGSHVGRCWGHIAIQGEPEGGVPGFLILNV
jgi:hypothetical protein